MRTHLLYGTLDLSQRNYVTLGEICRWPCFRILSVIAQSDGLIFRNRNFFSSRDNHFMMPPSQATTESSAGSTIEDEASVRVG